MTNEPIAAAIATFTQYVRQHTISPASDVFDREPTSEEVDAWRSAVKSVCDEMDALAQDPDSRLSDFETLRHKMGSKFPATPSDLLDAVGDAFLSAGRV
jgi:hypothetical protein